MRGLSRLAALLEAFLFVKGDPVTMEELVSTLGENPDEIEKALALLKERYGKDDSGITLHETGAGWSLATKKEYDAWLTEMLGKADASVRSGAGNSCGHCHERTGDTGRNREDPRRFGRAHTGGAS